MVDRKKHFANVAFGGGWSEELVARETLARVMSVLRRAAEECADRDVYESDLIDALAYVRSEIEKGPMLVAALQRALLEPLPALRQERVRHYVEMIARWSGL